MPRCRSRCAVPRPGSRSARFGCAITTSGRCRSVPTTYPGLIDELPALAALAARGGDLKVKGATELRRKESDRIAVLTSGFRQLGGVVDEFPDGFHVHGTPMLTGGTVDAAGDHRMAMAFAVAALGASGPSTITGHEVVDVSYPGLLRDARVDLPVAARH